MFDVELCVYVRSPDRKSGGQQFNLLVTEGEGLKTGT